MNKQNNNIEISFSSHLLNPSPFNTEETDFVKNIRKSHCKGCLNEFMPCSACAVLDCWLRKTYLPEGEWEKASQYDIHTKHLKDITDDINKRILEELEKEFKK